jgi:hypothetical protein
MAQGRFGRGDIAAGNATRNRHCRGFVSVKLPRHVIPKPLASGKIAFYYNVPTKYRKMGCNVSNEPLGTDYAKACGEGGRAETLNGLFDEWNDARKGLPIPSEQTPRIGTIDWLFREYKRSRAYLEKVKPRSRRNYEWNMHEICNTLTKRGDRIGGRPIKSVTSLGADKLYDRFVNGGKGARLRTAEKMVVLCRKAWRVVHRLHPAEFPTDIPNPWSGVTMATRIKLTKHAVTREQVYTFAYGCVERGQPECGAAAVICFEWLQRPENVIAGHIKWSGYRSGPKPTIRIEHHKTGSVIDHPLEEKLAEGAIVKFYEEAESILAKLTRRGVPMIVQRMRKESGVELGSRRDRAPRASRIEIKIDRITQKSGDISQKPLDFLFLLFL